MSENVKKEIKKVSPIAKAKAAAKVAAVDVKAAEKAVASVKGDNFGIGAVTAERFLEDGMQPGDGNSTYSDRIIDAVSLMDGATLDKGAKYELL